MDAFDSLAEDLRGDGIFHGYSLKRMFILFAALSRHDCMRHSSAGTPTSKTQQRMLERNFSDAHGLSAEQYSRLVHLYTVADMTGVHADVLGGPRVGGDGSGSPYVQRYFESEAGPLCCGFTMKVRRVRATAFARDDMFATDHVVKQCILPRCKRTWYLNKKTYTERLGEREVTTHTFYSWADGVPPWIANKSGKVVISCELLSDFAIAQACMRAGFNSYAAVYNKTVGRGKDAGLTRLTGDVLEQCWEILTVGKMINGFGPMQWLPFPGQALSAETPQEFDVFDANKGHQSGLNHWPGLRSKTESVLRGFWPRSHWMYHACSLCRREVNVGGHVHRIQAVCVDGCTATRGFKCHVHGCTSDIMGHGPLDRYCSDHFEEHGAKCAFWVHRQTPCQNQRQEGSLSCQDHQPQEQEYKRRNHERSWPAQQRARARQEMEEEEDMPLLRAIYGRRTTFGVLTASWPCGIICGMETLYEWEGMVEVDKALKTLFADPSRRPAVLFYDNACGYDVYLNARNDQFWRNTQLVVDRFHFKTHVSIRCAIFNNPNHQNNPLLWHTGEDGNPRLNFNSSMSESNNAWLSGFHHICMRMPRVLSQLVVTTSMVIRNEILLQRPNRHWTLSRLISDASTRSVAMEVLILSLNVLLLHLPIGHAGCAADYSLLGCFADSDTNRLMPDAYIMAQEESMSTEYCYYVCDNGFNTHFGTQYSRECWCAIDPALTKNGPERDHGECSMRCAGTTSDEHCGGFYKMLVYEITSYQGCQPEPSDGRIEVGHTALSTSEHEQIIGQPWDFQEKYDTTKFFTSGQGGRHSLSTGVPAGSCHVDNDHKKLLSQVDIWRDGALIKKTPRVFCGIYTHQPNHATKVKAIKETWASHCDGFVAFSDAFDRELNTFKIKHEGPEEYHNMWQKSRAIWKYINFHYKNDFDWFVLGGDDLFLVVENLRKYLLSDEIKNAAGGFMDGGTNPMYLGRRIYGMTGEKHRIYHHGGASYVLNQASVGLLASHLDDDACQPHTKRCWEDMLVGRCLEKNGVEAFDTRDAFGRERFHPYTPSAHFGFRMSTAMTYPWYVLHAIDPKYGRECCSHDSLSFHYVDEELMRSLYHFVYYYPRRTPANALDSDKVLVGTTSAAMKSLVLSAFLIHLSSGQAGCPDDYSLLGCYADSPRERLMPSGYIKAQEDSMSAEYCYFVCDDGVNTHFGTQYSRECWCAVDPDLNKNGPERDNVECNMQCAGTTSGELCGGFYNMLVYEITSEDGHKKLLAQVNIWEGAQMTTPRVFCGIFTHQANHATKVKAIKETWASHCDGFVAFSDVADVQLGTFKIKHEGPEEYDNMWQKSRAIWKYINFHYKNDFDWFLLGGDDIFVMVENLRKYLLSDEIEIAAGGLEGGGTNAMYLGRRLRRYWEDLLIFNHGGPSYVLNQASVGLLASRLDDDSSQPHTRRSWEDLLVGRILKKSGVEAFDTRDALGRERFHPYTPATHLGFRLSDKLEDESSKGLHGWYPLHAIDLKFGRECCSHDSISFHYVDEDLMRRLYHLVYICPKDGDDMTAADRTAFSRMIAAEQQVRELIRNICEEAGETRPAVAASLVARVLVAQRGYQRTNYWFENVAFVFDEYLANLVVSATDRPVSVLEVGSFEGGSTLWIAEHLLLHPDSMLICVDLWTGGPDMTDLEKYDAAGSEDRFRHNMAKAPNNERVNAIKGDSLLSLSGLIAAGGTSTFDFIYVDGSHSMKDLLADALLSFRLLKLGGIVIFDDTKHPDFPGVGRAMNAVIEALEEKNCVKVLYDEEDSRGPLDHSSERGDDGNDGA
eukprot:g4217.t1